ncbi:MAG TPA: hypothetical protein VJQ55_08695, partial [Candidatus Binatia bacterium]|nr:hypothetical protein [Candidatus Binatia bacterium]
MIRWQVDGVFERPRVIRRYHKANLGLYHKMDWALDITEAEFSYPEAFEGVPSRLIRRNPKLH